MLFDGENAYEAHNKTGGWSRTTSQILEVWAAERSGRRLWSAPVATGEDAEWLETRARAMLGLWPYDLMQLGKLWAWARFKLPMARRPSKVVCSEAVARICFDLVDFSAMCGVKPQRFDMITPADLAEAFHSQISEGLPE